MKYILEHWVNGDYISNHLRLITRENKRYLISDVQRYVRDWKAEPTMYTFFYKWARKFVKDANNPLGFRRSHGRRENTDGVMTYTVSNDASTFKCPHTFNEVFGVDLRDIQDVNDYPLKSKLNEEKREVERNSGTVVDFTIWMSEHGLPSECKDEFWKDIEEWDTELINHLKAIFKVNHVYYIYDKINEHKKKTILSKSMTLFHVNTFNFDKKAITFNENDMNRTIGFWLFEDKLVFQFEEGKDTW